MTKPIFLNNSKILLSDTGFVKCFSYFYIKDKFQVFKNLLKKFGLSKKSKKN